MRLVRVGVVKKAGEKPHRVTGAGPEDSKASSTPLFKMQCRRTPEEMQNWQ